MRNRSWDIIKDFGDIYQNFLKFIKEEELKRQLWSKHTVSVVPPRYLVIDERGDRNYLFTST